MFHEPRALLALSRARFDDPSGRRRGLFTSLAKRWPVIFVEEPSAAEPGVSDAWELRSPSSHLLVCRPLLRACGDGFAGTSPARVASMLVQLLRWQDVGEFVVWLDTPHALPIARRLDASRVVYDCTDAHWPARGDEGTALARDRAAARALVRGVEPMHRGHARPRTNGIGREARAAVQDGAPIEAETAERCNGLGGDVRLRTLPRTRRYE